MKTQDDLSGESVQVRVGSHVVIESPRGVRPSGSWWLSILKTGCPYCMPVVHAHYRGDQLPDNPQSWFVTFAHAEKCPRWSSGDWRP